MTIDAATFKVRFPEFDTIADIRVDLYLEDAQLEVGEIPWGPFYQKGVFLLAAHLLQIDRNRQPSGVIGGASINQVASRSVGDISVGFGSVSLTSKSSMEDWYRATQYGQEYYRLQHQVGAGMVAVS